MVFGSVLFYKFFLVFHWQIDVVVQQYLPADGGGVTGKYHSASFFHCHLKLYPGPQSADRIQRSIL
jgi:hypothetical protein